MKKYLLAMACMLSALPILAQSSLKPIVDGASTFATTIEDKNCTVDKMEYAPIYSERSSFHYLETGKNYYIFAYGGSDIESISLRVEVLSDGGTWEYVDKNDEGSTTATVSGIKPSKSTFYRFLVKATPTGSSGHYGLIVFYP
jgi:hypothetical protein